MNFIKLSALTGASQPKHFQLWSENVSLNLVFPENRQLCLYTFIYWATFIDDKHHVYNTFRISYLQSVIILQCIPSPETYTRSMNFHKCWMFSYKNAKMHWWTYCTRLVYSSRPSLTTFILWTTLPHLGISLDLGNLVLGFLPAIDRPGQGCLSLLLTYTLFPELALGYKVSTFWQHVAVRVTCISMRCCTDCCYICISACMNLTIAFDYVTTEQHCMPFRMPCCERPSNKF